MREIAAFTVAALIPIGVGSFGRDVPTVKETAAATEANLHSGAYYVARNRSL
jgi:hypothetical protein